MSPASGIITQRHDEKGFGFITPDARGRQIFIHINAFSKAQKRPIQGLVVICEKGKDPRGRSYAIQVPPMHGHQKIRRSGRQFVFSSIFSGSFLAFVGSLVTIGAVPFAIFTAYILFSTTAYLVYKRDTSSAEWDEWRTQESTLHWIALIGGWPGARIAQNNLRHKSRKFSFKLVYWLTVVVNCSVLAWLATYDGASKIQGLINTFH